MIVLKNQCRVCKRQCINSWCSIECKKESTKDYNREYQREYLKNPINRVKLSISQLKSFYLGNMSFKGGSYFEKYYMRACFYNINQFLKKHDISDECDVCIKLEELFEIAADRIHDIKYQAKKKQSITMDNIPD